MTAYEKRTTLKGMWKTLEKITDPSKTRWAFSPDAIERYYEKYERVLTTPVEEMTR